MPSPSDSTRQGSASESSSVQGGGSSGAVSGTPVPHASQQATTDQAEPAAVEDNLDVLDQEWADKARDIVEKTKNDPFLQSRELNKVKAEYLKIRFNKHIKVDDSHE